MTGVELSMPFVWKALPERVENGVARHVVRMSQIVHVEFPVDLLDQRHGSTTASYSSMYWRAVLHDRMRRRFTSRILSSVV